LEIKIMFKDLLKFDKSPILRFTKTKLSKTALIASVGISTLSVSTGIVPLTIAGIQNQRSAIAADAVIGEGGYGCGYFRMHQAWWGQYTYLNKCGALQLADTYGISMGLIGFANAKVPGWYKAPFVVANLYNGSLRTQLYHCAANNGQAYMRLYSTPWGMAPSISCT
jgi:hypothetical protein